MKFAPLPIAPATLVCAGALLFAAGPGIRPRADVADYPARAAGAGVAIGAAVVPANEVKKIFAADLNRDGYVVVEVGVYPDAAKNADVNPADFTLGVDPYAAAMRPVDAAAASTAIARMQDPNNPNAIHGSAGAAVALGNDPYDPTTGRRISPIASRTASAGNGLPAETPTIAPPPAPSGPRPADMEQELWAKSLPDGIAQTPVAGYLYFPKPSGKTKNQPWVLAWDGPAGRVRVTLQAPAKK